jgi:hypothetical protein
MVHTTRKRRIFKTKLNIMKFELKIEYLGKKENKHEAEKDMYHLTFKTYNAEVTGKFERSELRNLIEKLDNAII